MNSLLVLVSIGVFVGLVARFLLGGQATFIGSALLGATGSLLGGFFAALIGADTEIGGLGAVGLVGALLGVLALVVIGALLKGRPPEPRPAPRRRFSARLLESDSRSFSTIANRYSRIE